MVKKLNITIFEIFLFIYVLLPSNYYFLGLNLMFLLPLCFIFIWFVLHVNHKINISFFLENKTYWLCIIVISIISFFAYASRSIIELLILIGTSYIIIYEIYKKRRLLNILDILLFASFISCCLGIVECILQKNIFQIFTNSEGVYQEIRLGIWRTMAQFTQPINFANYLLLMSIILHYRKNTNISNSKNKFLSFLYFLYWINVIITVSRSIILAFIILQLIICIVEKQKLKMKHLMILNSLAVILLILVIALPDFITNFIYSYIAIFTNKDLSFINSSGVYYGAGDRINLYTWVLNDMDGKYLIGVGSKTFAYQINPYTIKTSIEVEYLHYLYYYGIIGLFFLIISYIGNLLYLKSKGLYNNKFHFEKGKNLNHLFCIFLLVYYFVLFTTTQAEVRKIYNIVMCIVIGYNLLSKKLTI